MVINFFNWSFFVLPDISAALQLFFFVKKTTCLRIGDPGFGAEYSLYAQSVFAGLREQR